MKKFVDPYRPAGRFFYFLLSLLLAMSVSRSRAQTAPATTLVSDVVYNAQGQPASGTLIIAWTQFTTADGHAIAAGSRTVTIGSNGVVSIALVPNAGSDPPSYYKATLKLSSGETDEEIWSVPATSPTTISAIRSKIVPAGTAIQVASRAYVDAGLATKATDANVVHLSTAETITGAKRFTSGLVASSGPRDPNQFYLGSLSNDDAFALRHTWSGAATGGFYNGVRSELTAATGGAYGGSQTAYVPFHAGGIMSAKGQLFGIFSYARGLGIGNTGFSNSVTECWGGSADVAPGSIPLCGFGEHDIWQGAVENGYSVFSAAVSGTPTATQLTYSGAVNEDALGERFLLDRDRTYTTGSVASITGNTVTGSGTGWTSALVGKYFKTGVIDDYSAPCSGDDQPIDGKCYGHWFKIKSVASATSLTLETNYDSTNLASSGAYVIADGVEISGFDTAAHTISYPSNSYTASWANADVIYSPPNHLMALQGPNLVFRPLFKTGRGSMNAVDGIRFANVGTVNMDTGIHFQGPWRTLLRTDAFANGVEGIDLSSTAFSSFALKLAQGASGGAIVSGTSSQFFDGTGWVFKTNTAAGAGVRSARFIELNSNSALDIVHPASAVVDFLNANGAVEARWSGGASPFLALPLLKFDVNNQDATVSRPATNTLLLTASAGVQHTGPVLPNTAGATTLGSAALPFSSAFIGGAATNNIQITGTATAARTFTLPDANSTAVIADSGATHNFLTGISSAGVITKAQPGFADLSGSLPLSQTPLTTRGDLLVANATPALARLATGAAGTVLVGGTDPSYSATPTLTSVQTASGSSSSAGLQLGAANTGLFSSGAGAVDLTLNGTNGFRFTGTTFLIGGTSGNLSFNGSAIFNGGASATVTLGNAAGANNGTLDLGSVKFSGLPAVVQVASDFTTAANTNLQTITGLTWTFPANTAINIPFECTLLYSQATATVSDSFGVQDASVAPTSVNAAAEMFTSATANTQGVLIGLSTTTATAVVTATPGATNTVYPVFMSGMIEHPSNAATSAFNIMVKTSTAGDVITVKRGSHCRIGPK